MQIHRINKVIAIDVRHSEIQIESGFKLSTLLSATTNNPPKKEFRSRSLWNSGIVINSRGLTRMWENFTREQFRRETTEQMIEQAKLIKMLGAWKMNIKLIAHTSEVGIARMFRSQVRVKAPRREVATLWLLVVFIPSPLPRKLVGHWWCSAGQMCREQGLEW